MKQEIRGDEMFKTLSKNSFIVFYTNFETSNSNIKPEP